jgi:hypothetical protein
MGGMSGKPSPFAPIVVAGFLLLTLTYFCSFYALLDPPPEITGAGTIYPTYRFGGEVSRVVYSPAYKLYLLVDRLWYMGD